MKASCLVVGVSASLLSHAMLTGTAAAAVTTLRGNSDELTTHTKWDSLDEYQSSSNEPPPEATVTVPLSLLIPAAASWPFLAIRVPIVASMPVLRTTIRNNRRRMLQIRAKSASLSVCRNALIGMK